MEVLEYCPESTRVLPREYSSTFSEVLELVVPVEIMLVVVEDHLFCDANFFQCFEDEFLLFLGEGRGRLVYAQSRGCGSNGGCRWS